MTRPITHAIYKATPNDFVVTEIMPLADNLSHEGEHLWLLIEKIGINTAFVAKLLANVAKIPIHDVGYSGLKDRHARTIQWFSLRLPKPKINIAQIENQLNQSLKKGEQIRLHRHAWHNKKLNRSTHKANHFYICLRQVIGDKMAIEKALHAIKQHGVPNFFGNQRFGINQSNLAKADTYFKKIIKNQKDNKKHHPKISHEHSLIISAARSHLFNLILQKRMQDGSWNQAITGDVFNLDGTGSLFSSPLDDTIKKRVVMGDIHPTAPLIGIHHKLTSTNQAQIIENSILNQDLYTHWQQALIQLGVKADRRAMRMMVQNLTWHWINDNVLVLDFYLNAGSFATSLLEYLTWQLVNGSQSATHPPQDH